MTSPAQSPPLLRKEIVRQVASGTLWSYLSFVLGKGLTFVSTVILARLLAPEHFGLMASCLVAIQYLDVVNDLGMDAAVIARRDKLEEATNAAFYIGLVNSLLFYAVSWLGAPAVAAFFKEPAIVPLFRTLIIVLPLSGIALVPSALIKRGLRFREKLIPDVVRSIAKGLVSIILALTGFGVWSLVLGQVTGELTASLLLWRLAGWRPTRVFDRQVTREMLGFGGHILMIGVAGTLRKDMDYLLIGRILGTLALGYYTLGYRLPELLISSMNQVISKVAFPALSQLQADLHELRSLYGNYLRYIALFTFPAGVGLAFTAPSFIHVFYTAKWSPTIPAMAFIALAVAIESVGFIPGVLYKAVSRPEILNRLSLIKLPVTFSVLWFCTRWDIAGVAAGQAVLAGFYTLLESVVVSRLVKFSMRDLLRALYPPIAGALVMAAVLTPLWLMLPQAALTSMLIMVGIGMLTYVVALRLLAPELAVQARSALRMVFGRIKS